MRRELPDPRMPNVTARMFALSPAAKVVAGVPMIGMAVGALVMDPQLSIYTWMLCLFGFTFGPVLLMQGVRDARERRHEVAQMARAREQIASLRDEVAALGASKRGLEKFLLERGYTNHKVRRWIALECGIVLPSTTLL